MLMGVGASRPGIRSNTQSPLGTPTNDAYAKLAAQLMSACTHLHMGNLQVARDHFDAGEEICIALDVEEFSTNALLYGLDMAAAGYA